MVIPKVVGVGKMKGNWVNNTKPVWKAEQIPKPCKICGFCPYGPMVEMFPLHEPGHEKMSCDIFGHDCPAFYNAEMMSEES